MIGTKKSTEYIIFRFFFKIAIILQLIEYFVKTTTTMRTRAKILIAKLAITRIINGNQNHIMIYIFFD